MNNLPQIISLATGMDVDKSKLWQNFQRIRTLVRAVNVRRGCAGRTSGLPRTTGR